MDWKYHLYINLKERTDRKLSVIKELKKLNINNPNRFDAIKHNIGSVGIGLSHIKCLEIAKKNKWPYVVIFQDDIIIHRPKKLKEKVNKYINMNFDVLYLGCWIETVPQKIYHNLLKIDKACCDHAMLIKSHYYDTLIQNYTQCIENKIKNPKSHYFIDQTIKPLQKKDNWYCLKPIHIVQKNGYSNNWNRDMNLEKSMEFIPTKNKPIHRWIQEK